MPDAIVKEPIIYTMPERFYTAPKKGLSNMAIFFIAVGALFVLVVGGSAWYFIQSARQPIAPEAPVTPIEISQPPITGAPSEVPQPPGGAPVVEEAPAAPIETTLTAPVVPPEVLPGAVPDLSQDVDADGLTAAEEQLLNTNPNQPDTDADGYLDGHEALHLYNPSGIAPQKLEDAGLATRYANANFGYEILYPAKWQKEEVDATGREARFKGEGTELISVTVADNPGQLPLNEWYTKEVPTGEVSALKQVASKSGDSGLLSPDGLVAYFARKDHVYILTYHLGEATVRSFGRIFEMMMNSFKEIE